MDNKNEINDFLKKLNILKEYCNNREKEITNKCLKDDTENDNWKFVRDEIRLWCSNLFNVYNEYDYILNFFENKELTNKIIKFDEYTDKEIKKQYRNRREIADINKISNAICSSEYMYTLFNKAGEIEFEKTFDINGNNNKYENFIFDSTLIVADYFKAIELYLCKKIYTKYAGEKIVINSNKIITIGEEKYFTRTMLGDYIKILENKNIDENVINLLKKWKKESRNAYMHKDYLKDKKKVGIIRKKTKELFIELEKVL